MQIFNISFIKTVLILPSLALSVTGAADRAPLSGDLLLRNLHFDRCHFALAAALVQLLMAEQLHLHDVVGGSKQEIVRSTLQVFQKRDQPLLQSFWLGVP
eukprot:g30878.t1